MKGSKTAYKGKVRAPSIYLIGAASSQLFAITQTNESAGQVVYTHVPIIEQAYNLVAAIGRDALRRLRRSDIALAISHSSQMPKRTGSPALNGR